LWVSVASLKLFQCLLYVVVFHLNNISTTSKVCTALGMSLLMGLISHLKWTIVVHSLGHGGHSPGKDVVSYHAYKICKKEVLYLVKFLHIECSCHSYERIYEYCSEK